MYTANDLRLIVSALGKNQNSGSGIRCRCPVHQGKNLSLYIGISTDGGLVLKCHSKGCDYKSIESYLIEKGLIPPSKNQSYSTRSKKRITSTIQVINTPKYIPISSAGKSPDTIPYPHLKNREFVTHYQPQNNGADFYVIRSIDKRTGRKIIAPWFWCTLADGSQPQWVNKWVLMENRPILNTREIMENLERPIMIVEGEKCALTLPFILPEYISTTNSGGSSSVLYSDWSVLKNRDVFIWPDLDSAGEKWKGKLIEILKNVGVKTIRLYPAEKLFSHYCLDDEKKEIISCSRTLPESFDCANVIDDGWNSRLMKELEEVYRCKNKIKTN